MHAETRLRLQNISLIIIIALIFGLLYNLMFYPHTLTEFIEAGSISFLIGLMMGILEEFVFKKSFLKMEFYKVLIIRAVLYSFLVSIILSLVLSIEVAFEEQITYPKALVSYLKGPLFQRDFLFSISFAFLILFIVQVIQLIGRANFLRLVLGLFHHPKEVERLFMFVDIKGSTTIAEKLDNIAYSNLIKDFFLDLSDAVILYRGEVYQYVGDEIIVVWPLKRAINAVPCFFKMNKIIDSKRMHYESHYHLFPQFKAGVHVGRVIVTEVGKLKKEIVYHGDVLNTTSRIEGKCNEFKQKLLISESVLPFVDQQHLYNVEEQGTILLKGKMDKINIFGVQPRNIGIR